MRILLLRTWLTNIGNGFIDKGAKALIQSTFPEAEITEVSGYSKHLTYRRITSKRLLPSIEHRVDNTLSSLQRGKIQKKVSEVGLVLLRLIKEELLQQGIISRPDEGIDSFDQSKSDRLQKNIVDLSDLVDVDLAILPGCILYPHVFERYKTALTKLRRRNIPLIFLGAGGGNYSMETQKYIDEVIKELKPHALITRDRTAYECYQDKFPYSYDGIDCAFFIDWWKKPQQSNTDFDVFTFDKTKEPSIDSSREIIRANHNPLFRGPLGLNSRLFFEKENAFFSDTIEDYLFLYSNSKNTHSDRIHACIPALVYGNSARFHYETPRANLFDRILDDDITEKLVSINQKKLERERQNQSEALKEAVNKINTL